MPDPTTHNLQLAVPAHFSDFDSWDSPVNSNSDILDSIWGGVASVALTGSPVTLSTAQWRSHIIKFSGTISGDTTVTFPALGGHHIIYNTALGSSLNDFVVILTTGSGGRVIGLPSGEVLDIVIDGTNIDFRNLGRVGDLYNHIGTAIPRWFGRCTVPPYLFCDGSSFSPTTYPALALYLGGTILPDTRGRARFSLNSGQSRITTAISGIDGNTLFSSGGDQQVQSHTHSAFIRDPKHHHGVGSSTSIGTENPTGINHAATSNSVTSQNVATNVHVNSVSGGGAGTDDATATFGGGASQNMPPTWIGGNTFIRAA